LGSREDEPSTITVLGQEVAVVEEFDYLDSNQQLNALLTFHGAMPSLMRLCRKSRQPDLEVSNLYLHQAEAV